MTVNGKGIAWSAAIHVALVAALLLGGVIGGCRLRKQRLEIVDFTIAVDPAPEVEEPKPEPQVKPPPTPPRPDDIVQQKPRPKPKPKPKPEPKKEPPKKEPPKIEKGKRVTKKIDSPVKPKERQTLTDDEIRKWLGKRAKIGEKTSLPSNEISLNASLLKESLYDAWTPPSKSASGSRPAVVVFRISSDGTLHSPKIETSSGSAAYDESCLEAVRRVGRVSGLSQMFIREYGSACPFEFKQTD